MTTRTMTKTTRTMTTEELVHAAERRMPCQLKDGRKALLIYWHGKSEKGKARVEFRPGHARSFPKSAVISVDLLV